MRSGSLWYSNGAALEIDHARNAGRLLLAVLVEDVRRADERATNRAAVRHPFLRRDEGVAVALRRREVFVDDRAEPREHRLLDLGRTGGRGVDHAAQAGQVEGLAGLLAQLEQPHEHRWHHLGVGDTPALHGLQKALCRELLHHHGGGAQAVHHDGVGEAGAVVNRSRTQVLRVLVEAIDLAQFLGPHVGAVHRAGVQRSLDALGPPGGPGRIDHRRAGGAVFEFGVGLLRRLAHQIAMTRQIAADGESHPAGVPGRLAQLGRDLWELGRDHHRLRAAVADDVERFLRGEPRIDRREIEAGAKRGPRHGVEGQRVLDHYGDVVAAAEPHGAEQASDLDRA